jgi:hypothetical protein
MCSISRFGVLIISTSVWVVYQTRDPDEGEPLDDTRQSAALAISHRDSIKPKARKVKTDGAPAYSDLGRGDAMGY